VDIPGVASTPCQRTRRPSRRNTNGVAFEVPQERHQRAEPLHAEYHIIFAEGERVNVDVERLSPYVDRLGLYLPR
jgi:hypothetical protein